MKHLQYLKGDETLETYVLAKTPENTGELPCRIGELHPCTATDLPIDVELCTTSLHSSKQ
jgi:hypothetical protein